MSSPFFGSLIKKKKNTPSKKESNGSCEPIARAEAPLPAVPTSVAARRRRRPSRSASRGSCPELADAALQRFSAPGHPEPEFLGAASGLSLEGGPLKKDND